MAFWGKWKVSINFSTVEMVTHKILKSWGERKPEMTTLEGHD
jgi:hypothetical protein